MKAPDITGMEKHLRKQVLLVLADYKIEKDLYQDVFFGVDSRDTPVGRASRLGCFVENRALLRNERPFSEPRTQ